jgi:hypothetical protein
LCLGARIGRPMILGRPYFFDIVLSDFGRESAIEFLRSAAILEKRIVHSLLNDPNADFFDEYRRMMFVVVGDIAYFKHSLITTYDSSGRLDAGVLIGMGERAIPMNVKERLVVSVLEQIAVGIRHGYRTLRVVIPCNTLAPLSEELDSAVGSPDRLLESLRGSHCGDDSLTRDAISAITIRVHTVPEVVVDEVVHQHGSSGKLLVLGTPSTLEIYRSALRDRRLDYKVLDTSRTEQDVINETVVASIDGDASRVRQLGQRIESDIVGPCRMANPGVVVIEACTDFDLGLGLNSRNCLVQRLVRDAYGLDASVVSSS